MSNFTTFFPSAGGGGGEGSGINSYAPFLVGTDDNNPQGYIHSTGVYTNPVDDSVWLKTGKQVDDVSNAYPNAFSYTDHRLIGGNFSTNQNLRSDIAFDGTTAYCMIAGTNGQLRILPNTYSTRAWGSIINKDSSTISGSQAPRAIAYDTTAGGWITHDKSSAASVINRWNSSFTSITSTFSIFAQVGSNIVSSMTYDSINNNLLLSLFSGDVYIYDLTTETYSSTFNYSTRFPSGTNGMSINPTSGKLWVHDASTQSTTNDVVEVSASTGVATGVKFGLYPNAHTTYGTVRGIAWKDGDELLAVTKLNTSTYAYVLSSYDADGTRKVGDATARTDSSGSGQPLFIKLK